MIIGEFRLWLGCHEPRVEDTLTPQYQWHQASHEGGVGVGCGGGVGGVDGGGEGDVGGVGGVGGVGRVGGVRGMGREWRGVSGEAWWGLVVGGGCTG